MTHLIEGFLLTEDLETRIRRNVRVFKKKIIPPFDDWASYMTDKFSRTRRTRTLDAQLRLWCEFRFPTPWIYFYNGGTLEGVYHFDNGKFYKDWREYAEGHRTTIGIITPLAHIQSTEGHVRRTYNTQTGQEIPLSMPSKYTTFKGWSAGIGFRSEYPSTFPGVFDRF